MSASISTAFRYGNWRVRCEVSASVGSGAGRGEGTGRVDARGCCCGASKSLFSRSYRAFSHGCVRLNDPFEFAYALLSAQEDDPVGFFQSRLSTGREQRVDLVTPVPVHLDYRTAFTDAEGGLQFRRDVYGRDAAIWAALAHEGVAISRPAS